MNSLVIPVYKNQTSIDLLLEALTALHAKLGGDLEVVFVVDGSPDRSLAMLAGGLSKCPFRSELVELSRNFGSFAAIRLGMAVAKGPYYAVMAADLQEPPELVETFFRSLAGEPYDIICGSREGRDDPFLSRMYAGAFWGMYRKLVQPAIPPGGVDVFACNQAVRDGLLQFEETNTSLVAQLFWLGFRRKFVPYQRRARQGGGKSAWSIRRKMRYMFDSIFAFTDLPISLLTITGMIGVALSMATAVVVTISWLLGLIPVLGYTPQILLISFSGSVNLLSTGILGGYVWRSYENTKHRPQAILMNRQSFPGESSP